MSLELPHDFVNPISLEKAYALCIAMQKQSGEGTYQKRREAEAFAMRGLNAARERDPRIMKVLEQAANVLDKMVNNQMGETRYRSDIPYNETIDPTEVQLWKKSYEMADQGTPLENFKWIYGAAAKLAYGL